MFPIPTSDKNVGQRGLPQMAQTRPAGAVVVRRDGAKSYVTVLSRPVSAADWNAIVSYYEASACSVTDQTLPAQPQLDPPFSRRAHSFGCAAAPSITLLKTDSVNKRIFVGEAGQQSASDLRLQSSAEIDAATRQARRRIVISEKDRILVLESGNLAANDNPGSLVRYDLADDGALRAHTVKIRCSGRVCGTNTTSLDTVVRTM